MGKIVGIDLGTTNSAVAIWGGEGPRLLPCAGGGNLTPSVVSFREDGTVLVGEEARRDAAEHAEATVYSAKRFLGRPFAAVAVDREEVHYEVVPGRSGEACFRIGGRVVAPEEVSALVLAELKRSAEAFLGEKVDGAVITVPANFNDAQRAATRKAGRLAGLEVRRILNEPTAAALAYGLDKEVEDERLVAVYDFGGGTFDVSILSVGEDILEVISTEGDPHLGGDSIDSRLAAWMLERLARDGGAPVDEDAQTLQVLREAAERAKISLSEGDRAAIDVSLPGGRGSLTVEITREQFDRLIGDLIDRTLACCDRVLAAAGKRPGEIAEVVLAGGSTRIPFVRQRVEKYFGRPPLCDLDPDGVVAMGASVQAGILSGTLRGVALIDVTSRSLGIETDDGKSAVVIPRNAKIPVTETRVFTTARDDQKAVHFHVLQGESRRAAENDSLGRFTLDGLREAKAGTLQLQVTFAIDINGMTTVTALDVATGREQAVTVSANTTAAREGTRPASMAPAAPALPAGDPDGLPPEALALLDDAESVLGEAGERMTRVDRASLMKQCTYLRGLAGGRGDEEAVARSVAALGKVLTRVKAKKSARSRPE